MSKLNLATLTNSIADPITLINQNLIALSGSLFFANPTLISALPATPIVGAIYLVTSAATAPLIPGDVLLYLATTSTGYTTFTPLDGAVAGNYIRSTTASVSTWTATASGGGGTSGSIGAITSGSNPPTPAVGTIATYNIVASSGLAVGQYYAFDGVSGTFLCTSTPTSTTVNLQNIDATVGVAIADATKIIATGKTGASGANGSASSWQLKTANYTALPGDRLRLNATASDIVITLPSAPLSTDADIFIQRLDLSTFKVLLRTGTNKINSLTSQDGIFAPATINLIEGVSYIDGTIGWLNQHNRLTFQSYAPVIPDPLYNNVLLLLNFNTNYADTSTNLFVVVPTSTTISSTTKQWGAGSAQFNGTTSYVTLPTSTLLNRGTGDFCFEMWFNQDIGASSVSRNIFTAADNTANGLSIDVNRKLVFWQDGVGNLITGTLPQLAEGIFHYVGVSRSSGVIKIWVDNASYATFNNTTSYDFSRWLIGSNFYNSKFMGYIDDFRLTNVARTITASPTAQFPAA